MKKIQLILFCMVFSIPNHILNGQSHNEYYDMINQSLLEYIKDTQNAKDSGILIHEGFANSYLIMDSLPVGFKFSDEIMSFGFKFFHIDCNVKKSLKVTGKKSIGTINYQGPIIEGDLIKIVFSGESLSRKKGKVYRAMGARRVTCVWRYNPDTERWILINTESNGI